MKGVLKMDITNLLQAINTVGFPITVCGVLLWQNMKQNERFDKQLYELQTVINNNTNVLVELSTKIDREREVKNVG